PEHHESNDITRVLGSVQEAGAALVELLAAVTAAEPAIALRRALRPCLTAVDRHAGTASRFIPLKRAAAYPTTTGIRQLAQVLTEPARCGGRAAGATGRVCKVAYWLPYSLRDTATAEALEALADLDLTALADIEPPRGRD